MVQLNAEKRMSLSHALSASLDLLFSGDDDHYLVSRQEFIMKKYRMVNLFYKLKEYGIDISFNLPVLPEDAYQNYSLDDEEYYDHMSLEYDYQIDHITAELCKINDQFLHSALQDTDWNIHQFSTYIHDIESEMNDEQVQKCKDSVNAVWGLYNEDINNGKEYASPRLEKLGCCPEPVYRDYFCPWCIILIENPNFSILNRELTSFPAYKQDPLYKELQYYFQWSLFGRYFPFVNGDFLNSGYESYLTGYTISQDLIECCHFHNLNYEVVIFLMLAETAAKELIDKIMVETKEVTLDLAV